jgi:hypothetical protein
MPSKRALRTRNPHKPITPEVLELFDRCLQLYAEGHDDGHESDELRAANKQLWMQANRIFGECWAFGNPTPADPCFDRPCPYDDPGNWLHQSWPDLQRDRQMLLAALAEWKKRKAS